MIASNLLVPVTHQPGEKALFSYIQTASALGLPAGLWPRELEFDGHVPTMHRWAAREIGADGGWTYRSIDGEYRIDIYNH